MHVDVQGTVASGFESVRDVFAANWQRIEVGASFSVVYQGETVVDLWGGWTDRDLTQAWQDNTLVNVYSTSKGMGSLVMAMLVDQGHLDYDERVSTYWPEFGAAGKQNITVAQLLSHQAGLAGVETRLQIEDLYNWQKMIDLLAAQKPLWEPGKAVGYHAVTWGFFPGELTRRITGQSLGEYFHEHVATPLDADFYIGLPVKEHNRVAELIGPNHARCQPSPAEKSTPTATPPFYAIAQLNPGIRPFKDACSTEWRCAELAASNGHSNARGIARVYGALANGGSLDGKNIISQSALDKANQVEVSETDADLVLSTGLKRSRGFILNTRNCYGPGSHSYGHPGAGGSTGFADPDLGLGVGYAMNQMENDPSAPSRTNLLIQDVYQCLKNLT